VIESSLAWRTFKERSTNTIEGDSEDRNEGSILPRSSAKNEEEKVRKEDCKGIGGKAPGGPFSLEEGRGVRFFSEGLSSRKEKEEVRHISWVRTCGKEDLGKEYPQRRA